MFPIEKFVRIDDFMSGYKIRKLPFAIFEDNVLVFFLILSINTLKRIEAILDFISNHLLLGNCIVEFIPETGDPSCFRDECFSMLNNEKSLNEFEIAFVKVR